MTIRISRKYDYSDLNLDFIAHPATGDVIKTTGVDAVKRSIRNLVLTNYYDRPFRPWIGSNAQRILFDNANPLTAGFLKDAIEEVITNFEPRVKVNGVEVKFDIDNNGYTARIYFTVLNSGEPVVSTLFLERIR
jgi:phage baseplate assembly protein W